MNQRAPSDDAPPPAEPAPPAIDVHARIEPGTVAILDQLTRWDLESIDTIRRSYAATTPPGAPPDPRVDRSDEVVRGLDGRPDVGVRWYRPAGAAGPLPCLVYIHGGAYIMGTLDQNDDRLDRMVLELGYAVASVDYRLAPEHPFPHGLDDAETVWRQIAAAPDAYGVDPARMVLGGASAGAGVAAALCLRLREAGVPQPILQLLIYPMLDHRELTDSIRAIVDPGHWGLWYLRANRMSWGAYLGHLDPDDVPPTASPATATDLGGLAPAFIGVGDVDAFVDEDLEYARRLSNAGVPTELHVYPGVIHGGWLTRPQTPRTRQFLSDSYAALAAAFDSPTG